MVLVLVVYDQCRSRGEGGYSLVWPTLMCRWTGYGVLSPPPSPPPPRPLGADMLEMTTDAQEGNNKTSQGLINTMQSHTVVKRFEITMIFYWISFIYGLKSPPLQVIMHQRQPWKLFYLQVIKKTFIFKGPMSIHSTPSMTDTIGTVTMCLS